MQILSDIYFEGGLPYSFMNLKTLQIFIRVFNKDVIPGITCLFKSSPKLRTLTIYTLHTYLETYLPVGFRTLVLFVDRFIVQFISLLSIYRSNFEFRHGTTFCWTMPVALKSNSGKVKLKF